MNLFAALERDFARLLQSTPAPDPLQTALDDLNVIEAQARRMIADAPPFDGNDRRGK